MKSHKVTGWVVGILSALVFGVPMLVQRKALESLRVENRALREQAELVAKLRGDLERAKAELSIARDHQELTREQFSELLRLRGEAGSLAQTKAAKAAQDQAAQREENQAKWASWVAGVRANGVRPADMPYLVQALTNESPAIRLDASKTVRLVGVETLVNTNLTAEKQDELKRASEEAVPNLLRMLADPDALLRVNAAITLGLLREQPAMVVPALAGSLNDQDSRVTQSAAKALGRFQAEARGAIPSLVLASSRADEGLKQAALAALRQITP